MTPILDEREFELINIIGKQLGASQRELSSHLNLSLGQTNMLIRRLITKGFIRIKQLNRRKLEYILTPKGFSEKMRKSVHYTLQTINSIGMIKNNLQVILKEYYDQGVRKFYVLGESDLASLIEIVLNQNFVHDYEVIHIKDINQGQAEGVVLICTEHEACPGDPRFTCVNLLERLAQNQDVFRRG